MPASMRYRTRPFSVRRFTILSTCPPANLLIPKMLTALFYPTFTLGENLLKNALLLWDRIEYISPNKNASGHYLDPLIRQAASQYTIPRVPIQSEKQEAHEAIIELLDHPLPRWFFLNDDDIENEVRFQIYPQKFLPETWDAIAAKGLIKDAETGLTTSALGLTMMSILAECCAGSEKRLITDKASAYSSLERFFATRAGAVPGRYEDSCDRLVTLSLRTLDFKNVSLSKILDIRQKENGANGSQYKALRHGYLRKIEDHANLLANAARPSDIEEIQRVFQQEIKSDLDMLKDELKDEAGKVVFSTEFAAAVTSLATVPTTGPLGYFLAGLALMRKKTEYRAARNKILRNHPMSWLYSLNRIQLI